MTGRLKPFYTGAIATLAVCALTLTGGCAHSGSTSKPADDPLHDMVRIPAGPFIMGTDRMDDDEAARHGLPYTWYSDATPKRTLELSTFYIDKYEMTNAQYLQFLNATELPLGVPRGWKGEVPAEGTNDYPVTGLNWYEAYLSCQHFGKRLPTEAEWEKAARGTDGRLYPWGDTFSEDYANVARGGLGRLMPVGSFPQGKSVYGVEDMIGNAWEWTKSWYRSYPESTHESDNYALQFKVIRGNSYGEPGHFDPDARHEVISQMSRANYRFAFDPKGRFRDSGVRCAKDGK